MNKYEKQYGFNYRVQPEYILSIYRRHEMMSKLRQAFAVSDL